MHRIFRIIYFKLRFFITSWPGRVSRLLLHGTYFIPFLKYQLPVKPAHPGEAFIFLFLFIIDILGLPEFYEIIVEISKRSTRSLTNKEKESIVEIFGSSVDLSLVRIDPDARMLIKKYCVAYVSFNTINYHENIAPEILIHEMVHVWQYQHFGSIYIYLALKAQRSGEGYNYGGAENLYTGMILGKKLIDFNFEQQGDIVQDYFTINCLPENNHNGILRSTYKYFVDQLEDVSYQTL